MTPPGRIAASYVGPGYGEELLPMQSFPSHHSTVEKDFLGVTIPPRAAPILTAISRSRSTRCSTIPICRRSSAKQMIQHLVTSNPSPAYISNCSRSV